MRVNLYFINVIHVINNSVAKKPRYFFKKFISDLKHKRWLNVEIVREYVTSKSCFK